MSEGGNRVLKTGPVIEPVQLQEVKDFLRQTTNAEDRYISALIPAARAMVEKITRRALLTQTWELHLDCFPDCSGILLPFPPLASVDSVTYYDENGDLQTLDPANYQVDTAGTPGRLVLVFGALWPVTEIGRVNAVCITFKAGWTAADLVPDPIRQAILIVIGHLFENRSPVVIGSIVADMPLSVDYLLSPYRDLRF